MEVRQTDSCLVHGIELTMFKSARIHVPCLQISEFNNRLNGPNMPSIDVARNSIQIISQDLYATLSTTDEDNKPIRLPDLLTVITFMKTLAG